MGAKSHADQQFIFVMVLQKTAEKSATMVFNFKEGLLYYKLRFSDLSARALKFYEILYFACLIFKIIMALYLLRWTICKKITVFLF